METRRLQYFVQIVDAGSINRAAAVIGIAQPALSQQLAILENELKVRLLDRSPTGVSPTEAGRRLYARAQVIVRQIGSLRLELEETEGAIAGVVAFGLPPSHGASIGNAVLARTRVEQPQLRLRIIEDGATALAAKLESGLLDMVVSPVRISHSDVEGEELLQEELFLVTANGVERTQTELAELAALPWVVTGSPNAIRGQLSAIFTRADIEPNIVAEVNSLPMVIRAVEDGLGVTLLPHAAIREAAAAGLVSLSRFLDPPPTRTVYLYWRRNSSPTPAETVVRGFIRDASKSLTT